MTERAAAIKRLVDARGARWPLPDDARSALAWLGPVRASEVYSGCGQQCAPVAMS